MWNKGFVESFLHHGDLRIRKVMVEMLYENVWMLLRVIKMALLK